VRLRDAHRRHYVDSQSMYGSLTSSVLSADRPNQYSEVRRILYGHLGIACGLECEVPERADAAVEGAPKPEPPAVTTNPAPKP
jgi:hypothetical protein